MITKEVTIKGTKIGRAKYAGCRSTLAAGLTQASVKSTITWDNSVKRSKTTFGEVFLSTVDSQAGSPEVDVSGSGDTTESFAGSSLFDTHLDSSSSSALATCEGGSGLPVRALAFASTKSVITLNKSVTAYVTNFNSTTVTPIDIDTDSVGKTMTVGSFPSAVAIH